IWEGRGFEKEKSDGDTWCRVHIKTQSACHLRRMWVRACWDQCLHPRENNGWIGRQDSGLHSSALKVGMKRP
ncbi:hypothetical protein ACJX0J_031952, partial [Zea mays]